MPEIKSVERISFFYKSIGIKQSIYLNNVLLAQGLMEDPERNNFIPDPCIIHHGVNAIIIFAIPLVNKQPW